MQPRRHADKIRAHADMGIRQFSCKALLVVFSMLTKLTIERYLIELNSFVSSHLPTEVYSSADSSADK